MTILPYVGPTFPILFLLPFSFLPLPGPRRRPAGPVRSSRGPSGGGPALCSSFLDQTSKQVGRTRHTRIEQATEASMAGSLPGSGGGLPHERAWRPSRRARCAGVAPALPSTNRDRQSGGGARRCGRSRWPLCA
jgi:hypothetical protein